MFTVVYVTFHWHLWEKMSEENSFSLYSSPRQLDCEGHDLENVCLLRTPADGNRIIEQAKGRNVVVIGTSFIGEYHIKQLTH